MSYPGQRYQDNRDRQERNRVLVLGKTTKQNKKKKGRLCCFQTPRGEREEKKADCALRVVRCAADKDKDTCSLVPSGAIAEKKKKQAKPLNHRQDASKTCAREQGSEPAYSKFDTEHAGGMLPASGDGACVWRMVWPQGGHLHKRHQPDLGAACWDRQLAPALLPVDGWTPPQTRHSWYF